MRVLIKVLLYPLMWLFAALVSLRNFLYNIGVFKSTSFTFPVIVIGNLSVGGTGKTPHAEWLAGWLKEQFGKVVFLSRGYKRKTSGFILAGPESDAKQIGDEPYQIYRKFPDLLVAVCESRVEGIQKIREKHPNYNLFVLDDAYQHRALKAGFYILLIDYNRPIFKDKLLPLGRLREGREGLQRADVIVFSRCPDKLTVYDRRAVEAELKLAAHQLVVFSRVDYLDPLWLTDLLPQPTLKKGSNVLLVTGIANPEALRQKAVASEWQLTHMPFDDHHNFTQKDVQRVVEAGKGKDLVLTTEKDFVRFLPFRSKFEEAQINLAYLPIRISFNPADEAALKDKLKQYVLEHSRNN